MSTVIRGTRVNLAAAICWENYMPLLRQTLYSQNVNLYLAPTADHRDTWMPLMRTVAIEGRCFVASANMATRTPGAPAPDSSGPAVPAAPKVANLPNPFSNGGTPELSPRTSAVNGDGAVRSKRRSVPCGDGNEIILPEGRPRGTPHNQGRERNSVVFEDGNEIVVPERPGPPRRHRRSSILCTDGNEMPYPPSISSWPAGIDPDDLPEEPAPPKRPAGLSRPVPPVWSGSSKGWASRGGSCIVGPFGDVLAGPQWEDDEGIIYADLDFDDCIRGRLDLDTAGSYSRCVSRPGSLTFACIIG